VIIKGIEKNLFSFRFFSKHETDFVLKEGSWAFNACISLLEEMMGWEQSFELQLPQQDCENNFGFWLVFAIKNWYLIGYGDDSCWEKFKL